MPTNGVRCFPENNVLECITKYDISVQHGSLSVLAKFKLLRLVQSTMR